MAPPMRQTGDPDEVLMPVPKADALQHIEIQVLRQISDNLSSQGAALTLLTSSMQDVRERLIRIEAQDVTKRIEMVEAQGLAGRAHLTSQIEAACVRINTLEASQDRRNGALSLVEWLSKYAPWLLAGVAAFVAGIGIQKGH